MSQKETCFVIGPIGPEDSETRVHADWLYEGVIKPAIKNFPEFSEPVRADKIAQPGMITTQVIEMLLEAKLVIADLSLSNPNAFYEIGIRHMVQKPIVHMQLKQESPPFDVNGYRAIRFSMKHPADIAAAQGALVEQIRLANSPEHRVENPVTHARGAIRLEKTATPEQKVLITEMRSISERLALLETRQESGRSWQNQSKAESVLRVIYHTVGDLEKLKHGISMIIIHTGIPLSWSFKEIRTSTHPTLEVALIGAVSQLEIQSLRDRIVHLSGVLEVRTSMDSGNIDS
jgi:hypothetical protein